MKKKLELISDMTGANKSTVSKAIRHCYGVDPLTREQILMTAKELGVEHNKPCSIYFILPDRPVKFIEALIARILPEFGMDTAKFNLYPPESAFVLENYLENAKKSGARLAVIFIRPDDRQYEILKHYAKEIPMIFIFDSVDIQNTFFIGSDAFDDGRLLGMKASAANGNAVALDDGSECSRARIKGFAEGFGREPLIIKLNADCTASEIARAINAADIGGIRIIYAASASVREAALAAVKLGLRGKCKVLGHEFGDTPFVNGDISGVEYVALCRAHEKICDELIGVLKRYAECRCFPDRKATVIPSDK